ncbi:ABC transporter permease subunit [Cohnella rhizosphaerae]|uniref:ABC transporter permease subunit n=1 Tax=Cohnella rhizosphaerae TaxID=1457232 RepID=A0A9X4L5Q3_9BACL|nr:ABC transporter permease subunit [Cohnella rhizosphaerae]MDG0813967.1 ABC transporter permease subunit [Cohnella rhizosphaerae]
MSHLLTVWNRQLRKQGWLYLLVTPGILYFVIFKYLPMTGLVIAFQNYQPFLGIAHSKWVGLKHFDRFIHEPAFWMLMRNTLVLSLYNIVFFFPLPILIALMLNELRIQWMKRVIQTVIYIPHFMSWVVVVGLAYMFFTTQDGIVNNWLSMGGADPIPFLGSDGWFRPMITLEVIWKETGWGTIIFLAAISGVDPGLYESAKLDGANRFRQMWHITLPAIRSTIIILAILRLGSFMENGFEQIFLMLNSLNRDVGEVFDTYVYTSGVLQGNFSYSAAIGLFKSVISLVLVVAANYGARKWGEEGIY